jgi:uncharacterized Zn finger protein (UPF0148 family)
MQKDSEVAHRQATEGRNMKPKARFCEVCGAKLVRQKGRLVCLECQDHVLEEMSCV